jgi:hypothetical protein
MKHIVLFASFPNIHTVADLGSVRNKCVEHAVVNLNVDRVTLDFTFQFLTIDSASLPSAQASPFCITRRACSCNHGNGDLIVLPAFSRQQQRLACTRSCK